jgi:hypothetical protein
MTGACSSGRLGRRHRPGLGVERGRVLTFRGPRADLRLLGPGEGVRSPGSDADAAPTGREHDAVVVSLCVRRMRLLARSLLGRTEPPSVA